MIALLVILCCLGYALIAFVSSVMIAITIINPDNTSDRHPTMIFAVLWPICMPLLGLVLLIQFLIPKVFRFLGNQIRKISLFSFPLVSIVIKKLYPKWEGWS